MATYWRQLFSFYGQWHVTLVVAHAHLRTHTYTHVSMRGMTDAL